MTEVALRLDVIVRAGIELRDGDWVVVVRGYSSPEEGAPTVDWASERLLEVLEEAARGRGREELENLRYDLAQALQVVDRHLAKLRT